MFGHKEVQGPLPFVGTEPGIFTTFVLPLYDFRITTCGGEFWRLRQQHGNVGQPAGNMKTKAKLIEKFCKEELSRLSDIGGPRRHH